MASSWRVTGGTCKSMGGGSCKPRPTARQPAGPCRVGPCRWPPSMPDPRPPQLPSPAHSHSLPGATWCCAASTATSTGVAATGPATSTAVAPCALPMACARCTSGSVRAACAAWSTAPRRQSPRRAYKYAPRGTANAVGETVAVAAATATCARKLAGTIAAGPTTTCNAKVEAATRGPPPRPGALLASCELRCASPEPARDLRSASPAPRRS